MQAVSTAALTAALLCSSVLAQSPEPSGVLALRSFTHDPLEGPTGVPPLLAGGSDIGLWVIQFERVPTEAARSSARAAGAEIHGYLPDNAHVARMPAGAAARVGSLPGVRSVTRYLPAFRVEPFLLHELRAGRSLSKAQYNVVVVDKKTDKPSLTRAIGELGGEVVHEQPDSILLEARLTHEQLLAVVRRDEVLWIDRWTPPGEDMDNVRIQGGGAYVETVGGFTGQGVRGHIYEGIQSTHPDFTNTPTNVLSCGDAQNHGHATSGIVFGNGTSNSAARGMAPDATPYYTNYTCVTAGVSRNQVVDQLVNTHEVLFTTASWGGGRTPDYTSVSAQADDIVFDHDIPWTQSQSNAGTVWSRPEAWAKNVISIGGVDHDDNASRADDSWNRGFGSIGPAADGRMKPELCAYYDSVHTSDRTGSNGYTNGDDYTNFGGTSAATPIVAGHNAIAIQMFTDGLFSPQRVPGGTRFQNRPHAATVKTLQVANARQYEFHGVNDDNARKQVGFGFPDLRTIYDNRARMLVVDETDVLTQGGLTSYPITVLGSDPELKVAMAYTDPAANPGAATTRINNLDLLVIAPDGTLYHGNRGLEAGNYSTPGGSPNTIDTLECVFVRDPAPGTWVVRVSAPLIAQDGHVETAGVDADYGLCVSFGRFAGAIEPIGSGCVGSGTTEAYCAAVNPDAGSFAATSPSNEYAHEVHTDVPLSVTSFQIYMASQGGTQVVGAAIYAAAPNGVGPADNALATTTLSVGAGLGWYSGTFASPVNIPAGNFYISVDNTSDVVFVSNLSSTTGAIAPAYFRNPYLSGNWGANSGSVRRSAVRVFCQNLGNDPAAPLLDRDGLPEIGQTLAGSVDRAAPNSAGVLALGFTPDFAAPLDLLGAPGCVLLNEITVSSPLSVDGNGQASIPLALPADGSLIGIAFSEQALVLDAPANMLGLVSSNGVRVTIGADL